MWTYSRDIAAHLGNGLVTIPDQIYDDQREHDEKGTEFPAIQDGVEIMVRLDGNAYGLHTVGTGDPVVIEVE